MKTKPPEELKSVKEVTDEFNKLFARKGIKGVLGFVITVKTGVSKVQLKWGNTRIHVGRG